ARIEPGQLPAARKRAVSESPQRLADAVEALVFEKIVDELTGHQRRIGEELLDHRLEVAARGCGDEAVDIVDIDVRPEAGRGDERQRFHAILGFTSDLHSDRPAEGMTDKVS